MKKWIDIEIKKLGRVVTGKTPPTADRTFFDGPYHFVSPKDLDFDSSFIKSTLTTVTEKSIEKFKNQILPENSVMFTSLSYGFGKMGITNSISLTNQQINSIIVDDSKHDFRFVYYLLRYYKNKLFAYNAGIVTPIVPKSVFEKIKVRVPDTKTTQSKIASILSAYDDLIENNLKRIKLLEEKAQLHYKELMQELTYSKTTREKYIKDCLAFYIGGGWGEEDYKEKFTEPAYVIRGTDIPDTRGGNVSGIPLRFHKSSNLESRKMQIGDIVFEISNGQINNIGRTVLISKRLLGQFDQPVMCASFAKLIRVNEKVSPEFFYLYLNEGQENGLLYQYKSNSANGINNFAFETFIDEVKISIPKESELKAFTEKVKPIFTLISTLGEQNSKLREARDILLPKLMNGQIEV